MNWRFAVEDKDIPLTELNSLYRAAVSVYKTIPILQPSLISGSKLTLTEVEDPSTKADVLNFYKRSVKN